MQGVICGGETRTSHGGARGAIVIILNIVIIVFVHARWTSLCDTRDVQAIERRDTRRCAEEQPHETR